MISVRLNYWLVSSQVVVAAAKAYVASKLQCVNKLKITKDTIKLDIVTFCFSPALSAIAEFHPTGCALKPLQLEHQLTRINKKIGIVTNKTTRKQDKGSNVMLVLSYLKVVLTLEEMSL